MGIVRRQTSFNLILNYLGVGLGFVNKVLLFGEILSRGQFGLLELLLTFMVVGTELALLGSTKLIVRFFPFFHGHPFREGGFNFFLIVYSLVGFLLVSGALWLGRPLVVASYQEEAPLFVDAFGYVFPMMFAFFLYRVTSGLAASLFRSVLPVLSFDVVLKVLLTLLILSYSFDWFSFEWLLRLFLLAHFVPALIMLWDLRKDRLPVRMEWSIFRSRMGRLMIQYGIFSTLSDTTAILVQRVDMILIGAMLGEALAGNYGIAIYFAALIGKPGRAMFGILLPLIATRLKERRMEEVNDLFQKSAMNSLLVGGLLFVGLWVNLDSFFQLLPTFQAARDAAILLGASLLFNLMTGPHRNIIINTRYYRYDLYSNLVLLVLVVLTDLYMIPRYGISGAALATLLVTAMRNIAGAIYVKYRLGLQSVQRNTWLALGALAGILMVGLSIPELFHPLATMVARSAAVTGLFVALVYFVPLSPELKELMLMPLEMVRKRFQ